MQLHRRDFLRVAAATAVLPLGRSVEASGKRKPNVILFFTDDQGTLDLNCYGSHDLYTPNLDRLAQRGTRFSQFYVGAPVCSPSRATLMTGRCPQRAGVPSNVGRSNGLPPEQITIAEMLKPAGYRTALFGKWHLGEVLEQSPNAQGFDEFLGHKVGCIDNYSHFFYWSGPNRHDLWKNEQEYWEDGSFFPEIIARETCSFIEKNKDRPFFIYAAFNVPHYPMQGTEKYRSLYSHLEEPRAAYAAFMSTLDEKVGRIIDKVDSAGLREDTLIVFLSDHGHSIEQRANFGGGNAGPYRGNKFTLWEGGIRVPCIVSMPGRIPENEVRDQIAISADWLPTIAHYCGIKPPQRTLDGRNISSVIESNDAVSPHKLLHWQLGKQWAVRDGDWKLVVNAPGGSRNGRILPKKPDEKIFLSNMSEDISESKNLADQHPDVVRRLTKLHEKWLAEVK